jgi:hypothetical protein
LCGLGVVLVSLNKGMKKCSFTVTVVNVDKAVIIAGSHTVIAANELFLELMLFIRVEYVSFVQRPLLAIVFYDLIIFLLIKLSYSLDAFIQ